MTQEQINQFRAAASLGLIPDDENPIFLFSNIKKEILMDIANGILDPVQLAKMELRNRGWDTKTGKWVGWRMAEIESQSV